MQTRQIGPLRVSAIGLGCMGMMPIYGEPDPGDRDRAGRPPGRGRSGTARSGSPAGNHRRRPLSGREEETGRPVAGAGAIPLRVATSRRSAASVLVKYRLRTTPRDLRFPVVLDRVSVRARVLTRTRLNTMPLGLQAFLGEDTAEWGHDHGRIGAHHAADPDPVPAPSHPLGGRSRAGRHKTVAEGRTGVRRRALTRPGVAASFRAPEVDGMNQYPSFAALRAPSWV
jgi:hypothetical protein